MYLVEGILVRALLCQMLQVVGKAGATVASRRDKRERQYAHSVKAIERSFLLTVVESLRSNQRLVTFKP